MPVQKRHVAKARAPADEIALIVRAEHSDPFHILGAHPIGAAGSRAIAIRAFLPEAKKAWIVRKSGGDPGGEGTGAKAGPDARTLAGGQRPPLQKGEATAIPPPPTGEQSSPLQKIHPNGFFEANFPGETEIFPYRLRVENAEGHTWEFEDPYRFPPVLSDFDLHLMGEGTHYRKYEKLGAHVAEIQGVAGVTFAVWAPNAKRVSVVGNFNHWDGRRHPMRIRGGNGIWELFIPGLTEGEVYKYEIKSHHLAAPFLKADPYGFLSELRPRTASIVHDIGRYRWGDGDWLEQRAGRQSLASPMSIYEVHLGSWRRSPTQLPDGLAVNGQAPPGNRMLNYRELAEQLVDYAKQMGFTHLELLPVMEHPLDESWGYQTTGYFAPTSRFGAPEDFMAFVDHCHQNGIGVILDWVPAHFPSDAHGLDTFDGTHLFDHADPRRGLHQDWGTRVFNYGRREVSSFLLNSALFWLDRYHADGLRVDAVASMLYLDYSRKPGEWLPNRFGGNEDLDAIQFIKRFNELAHGAHPGVLTVAEESTAWPAVSRPTYVGGLGFSLKWNMGWMHDTLLYFSKDPVHRKHHHNNLTFSLLYAFNENFVLVLSHDEVVHGKRALLAKMPGDDWQKFATLRALYAFQFAHPGKKLLFMGGEFGQWHEWNAATSLDWHLLEYEPHRKLQHLVRELNRLYRAEPALYEVDFDWTGFEWIDFNDADNSVVTFIRRARRREDYVVVVCNFTPVVRQGYRVGVPEARSYREVLNTDDAAFGGGGLTAPAHAAQPVPWHNQPCSLELTLPPLAVVFLKP